MGDLFMRRDADISLCGRYRYSLRRTWGDADPLVFVMLNPSTADAEKDDPTIRRCNGLARREGYSGIVVVNVSPYRATDPRDLAGLDDMTLTGGEWAASRVGAALDGRAGPVVVAWGAHPLARRLWRSLPLGGERLVCLGVTKDGSPRHPLYVRSDAPLVPWSGYPGEVSDG